MAVVNITNMEKRFRDKVVFHNFSMKVEENEFVVIAGKSGSGKSTLLNIIGLLDKADSGDVEVFGKKNLRPFSIAAEKILKEKIGYLFQNFALVEQKSVYYNLFMSIEHIAMSHKKEAIAKALSDVGLSGYENKKIYECSGGEQQRVAIARLLLKPCELILADEPTGSLDAENKHTIYTLLKKLQDQGKTVIVVSHDLDIIQDADRVITI